MLSGGMRVTSKGQVTIPIEIRERLGLLPHTEVRFEVEGNIVRLVREEIGHSGRGQRWTQFSEGPSKIIARVLSATP